MIRQKGSKRIGMYVTYVHLSRCANNNAFLCTRLNTLRNMGGEEGRRDGVDDNRAVCYYCLCTIIIIIAIRKPAWRSLIWSWRKGGMLYFSLLLLGMKY